MEKREPQDPLVNPWLNTGILSVGTLLLLLQPLLEFPLDGELTTF